MQQLNEFQHAAIKIQFLNAVQVTQNFDVALDY